ncbi:Hypothetical_protein [Hexamita inflata]|uniref:Hypothetical_protein n=1 Tax=Hexamita inflata TaxID=28002 RepID=A0AA86TPV7_9EUKA|nr:Hypothetical protein HINF_LOCUS10007 [Hexamita inflata]
MYYQTFRKLLLKNTETPKQELVDFGRPLFQLTETVDKFYDVRRASLAHDIHLYRSERQSIIDRDSVAQQNLLKEQQLVVKPQVLATKVYTKPPPIERNRFMKARKDIFQGPNVQTEYKADPNALKIKTNKHYRINLRSRFKVKPAPYVKIVNGQGTVVWE